MVVVMVLVVSRIRTRATGRLGLPLSAIGFAVSAGMTRIDITSWTSPFLLLSMAGGHGTAFL